MTTIYALTDPETLEVRYVGKTTLPLNIRLRRHVANSRHGTCPRVVWFRALTARGLMPGVGVLEFVEDEESGKAEKRWIARFRSAGANLVNATSGGQGHAGRTISPATRQRLSESLTGRTLSPEHRQRISDANRGRRPHNFTNQTKQRLSESARARTRLPLQPETRAKISAALRGNRNGRYGRRGKP